MSISFKNLRIAYIHGRLGPHIMHGRLAKSVNAEFQMVDKYKIWNDGEYSKLYLIYSWIYNAFAFKKPSQYDIFLVSGPHFSPIIMKFFRLKKKQKVIVHLGDETMYFLYDKWYSRIMQKMLIGLLNKYDALLCEGQMAADLAILNGINKPKIYTTYLGVPIERQAKLLALKPNLNNNNLIFISTGPNGWRCYYKGLDLMIKSFAKAFAIESSLTFTILGEWDKKTQSEVLKACSENCKNAINFVGHTKEIDLYLSKASMYFHAARGDAFPTVVLEAMSAGLIPLVSVWTGSKEVVGNVDKNYIVELDENKISAKIIAFTKCPVNDRINLSNRMKEESKKYTEKFALKHYQNTFNQIIEDLKVNK